VAPRPDGTDWISQSIQRLCAKRVYLGEASRYVEQDVDGRGAMVNKDAHPALVTEQAWRAAQMNPRIAKGGKTGKPLPLLSGLGRCAGCRYSLSLGTGPKGERMYRCRAKHASGRCPSPTSIMADPLESYVEEMVLSEIDGVAILVPDSRERDRARGGVEQARSDLDGFRQDRAARRKLGTEWHDWLDDYMRALREAEATLDRIQAQSGAVAAGLTRDHYLDLAPDERREVLTGFIDCVFVRRSPGRGRNSDPIEVRTRVLWRGEGPTDLPRRRVVNPIVAFDFEDRVEAGVAATQDRAELIKS